MKFCHVTLWWFHDTLRTQEKQFLKISQNFTFQKIRTVTRFQHHKFRKVSQKHTGILIFTLVFLLTPLRPPPPRGHHSRSQHSQSQPQKDAWCGAACVLLLLLLLTGGFRHTCTKFLTDFSLVGKVIRSCDELDCNLKSHTTWGGGLNTRVYFFCCHAKIEVLKSCDQPNFLPNRSIFNFSKLVCQKVPNGFCIDVWNLNLWKKLAKSPERAFSWFRRCFLTPNLKVRSANFTHLASKTLQKHQIHHPCCENSKKLSRFWQFSPDMKIFLFQN